MAKADVKSKLNNDAAEISGEPVETSTPKARPEFKRKAAVSVPQLKLTANTTVFIEVNSPIKMIEISDKDAEGGKSSCPAINVTDMEDGEIKQLLLDKISHDAFEGYGDKLVGMKFEVTKGTKVQSGKNGYHPYTIYELE